MRKIDCREPMIVVKRGINRCALRHRRELGVDWDSVASRSDVATPASQLSFTKSSFLARKIV